MEAIEAENNRLKQLIVILEQISMDLMPIVMKCKCDYNSVKLKTKLNVLKQKYDFLKQSEDYHKSGDKCDIIDKINRCGQSVSKIIIKRIDEFDDTFASDEDKNRETMNDNRCVTTRRRGRRPKMLSTDGDQRADQNLNKEFGLKIRRKYERLGVKKEVPSYRQKINKKRNESQVLCDECGKRFRDTYELKFHMWRHTGVKLFKCNWPGCDKEVGGSVLDFEFVSNFLSDIQYTTKYLAKHQKTHSDPKRFVCQHIDCKESFESSQELSQHFEHFHGGHKPFKCNFVGCLQEFTAKANLLQHHNWVHSDVNYPCEWPGCEDKFKRKSLLNTHMSSKHMGDMRYRCQIPGCQFKSCHSKSFARHKLIHSGEKPYPCQVDGCTARFRQSHQLKSHQMTHTGETPISCRVSECDQRFKTKRVMLSHLQKFHGIDV
ncbi:unnamed protein product [Oppiella nova]|uniref:C2H2-type domain-containing protein n=1 Tax=Oppiella nova TaxID=334625 RepID=A0A7R9LB15_9ACAR|nr:unnamed protein product [Oppiella nova]CAG2161750.1 unnamed protein product [Oppiella nova]